MGLQDLWTDSAIVSRWACRSSKACWWSDPPAIVVDNHLSVDGDASGRMSPFTFAKVSLKGCRYLAKGDSRFQFIPITDSYGQEEVARLKMHREVLN